MNALLAQINLCLSYFEKGKGICNIALNVKNSGHEDDFPHRGFVPALRSRVDTRISDVENFSQMNFILQDSLSTYWIRRDMFGGYTITPKRENAMIFKSVSGNTEIIKEIYKAMHPKKIRLLVFKINI